jgi:hypothetical protein
MQKTTTLILVLALASTTAFLDPPRAAAQEAGGTSSEPQAEPAEPQATPGDTPAASAEEPRRNRLLWYLPNRAFDVLDLVRARARIGLGFAADARVTVAEVFVGAYGAGYVGLPGPRRERKRPRLLGPESQSGFKVLFAGATSDSEYGPDYSPTEVGAGVHLGILGIDLGADFYEAIDLLAGFILLDPRKDDF